MANQTYEAFRLSNPTFESNFLNVCSTMMDWGKDPFFVKLIPCVAMEEHECCSKLEAANSLVQFLSYANSVIQYFGKMFAFAHFCDSILRQNVCIRPHLIQFLSKMFAFAHLSDSFL
jgi:hypothetical protein